MVGHFKKLTGAGYAKKVHYGQSNERAYIDSIWYSETDKKRTLFQFSNPSGATQCSLDAVFKRRVFERKNETRRDDRKSLGHLIVEGCVCGCMKVVKSSNE